MDLTIGTTIIASRVGRIYGGEANSIKCLTAWHLHGVHYFAYRDATGAHHTTSIQYNLIDKD